MNSSVNLDSDMVRVYASGGAYVPVLYPFHLPTTADEPLDSSLKGLGYLKATPSLKVSGEKAVLRIGLVQVSKEMFDILLYGCSGLVVEWHDNEDNDYRIVVTHMRSNTRSLIFQWPDAISVDLVCKLKAPDDYDFYTNAY